MCLIWTFFLLLGLTAEIIYGRENNFSVYWNVPSFQCNKNKFNFSIVVNYGIIQNKHDKFRGNAITILYDPGHFPAIIDGKDRNGGIPQEGNLDQHLAKFENDVLEAIPDKDFKGLGVIDFEHWRPNFRHNWGIFEMYKERSRKYEKNKWPNSNEKNIENLAADTFDKSAYLFMDETLKLATKLRPNGKWGYYIFPHCFNLNQKRLEDDCSEIVKEENDRSKWMYKTGTALYPSVYLIQKRLNEEQRAEFIQHKVSEAMRIANKSSPKLPVYVYTRFKYVDTQALLSKGDMLSNIKVALEEGADGVVIWGSSNDVNTNKKCGQLQEYLEKVIVPILETFNIKVNA